MLPHVRRKFFICLWFHPSWSVLHACWVVSRPATATRSHHLVVRMVVWLNTVLPTLSSNRTRELTRTHEKSMLLLLTKTEQAPRTTVLNNSNDYAQYLGDGMSPTLCSAGILIVKRYITCSSAIKWGWTAVALFPSSGYVVMNVTEQCGTHCPDAPSCVHVGAVESFSGRP